MSEMLPGPQKIDCPDGCGLFGTPTRNGHVRGCKGPEGSPCRSCLGRRSRAKGQRKQRAARKGLGIERGFSLGADHEEMWSGNLRVEVKSGGFARPVATKFRLAQAQSEASRPFGDNRPFVFVAMPDGESDGLVVLRLSEIKAVAVAVVEALMEVKDG